MDYLITLVHGTFASSATYIKEGSNFRESIKKRLQPHQVEFVTHGWNGKNNHNTRIAEGEKLSQVLTQQLSRHPEKKKIIISHSHGGNISMYALRELKDQARNFELITISTPFLNARKRNFRVNIDLFTYMLMFMRAVLFLGICGLLSYWLLSPSLEGLHIIIRLPITIISVLAMLLCLLLGITSLGGEELEANIKAMLRNVDLITSSEVSKINMPPLGISFPHLVLIDQGDEIRFWFSSLFKLWEIIFDLQGVLLWIGRLIYMPLSIMVFIFIILALKKIQWLYFNVTLFFGLSLLFLIAIFTLLMPIIFLLIRSNVLTLGKESLRYSMLIRIEPSITPLQRKVEVVQYNFKRKLFGLKHSIYDQEKVRRTICQWIIGNQIP